MEYLHTMVRVADLDKALEARLTHGALTPLGLLLAQGDAYDVDAALASGVHRHAAPAAADVEVPVAGLEVHFLEDEAELVFLRLVEGGVRGGVVGAGVGHRIAQEELVEIIANVIMIRNDIGIALLRVLGKAVV